MDVVPVILSANTTLTSQTGDGNTHFYYDENENRVKLVNTVGDIYYFVYDPTASIPAVVYEQGVVTLGGWIISLPMCAACLFAIGQV